MSAPNDGGPAFPMPHFIDLGENTHWGEGGMTLRDYFAAAALQGILASPRYEQSHDKFARDAYWFADTMIAHRTNGGAS